MARDHLSKRGDWQQVAAARGEAPEVVFGATMQVYLQSSGFELTARPRDLRGIYGTREKNGRVSPHGIIPEFCIRNPFNGKAVFVEIKRQKAGGNAHERACKFMMPGILDAMRRAANQPKSVVPFWWIFSNGIASDPYYRQEISFWFRGLDRHLLLWPSMRDPQPIIDHYERHIRDLLR